MSVNVYLNNKVRELYGFGSVPYSDGSGDKMMYKGLHLFGGEKGRLYLMWDDEAVIPDELKELVEEISWYDTIPQMGRREAGVYRYESAECELTPGDHGNAKREKPVYWLKLKAKNMEDIRVLIHKVKTGAIRPEESYEEPQGGKTRQQLENELAETQHQLGKAREMVEILRDAGEQNTRLRQLARSIKDGSVLPWIFRSTVAAQIDAILDDE